MPQLLHHPGGGSVCLIAAVAASVGAVLIVTAMATQRDYYELYRRSSIGVAMMQTLDEMVNEQLIEPQLAFMVMNAFDKAASEVLAEKTKAKMQFKGHLDVYRFCDEVWTFMIKDVSFKLESSNPVTAERIKIVSCNAKKPGET